MTVALVGIDVVRVKKLRAAAFSYLMDAEPWPAPRAVWQQFGLHSRVWHFRRHSLALSGADLAFKRRKHGPRPARGDTPSARVAFRRCRRIPSSGHLQCDRGVVGAYSALSLHRPHPGAAHA